MTLNIVYFAWVRERIGIPSETVETNAETIADLVAELTAREDRYAVAFADMDVIKAALDQTLVPMDTPIGTAREIAFFPPMTGG